MDPKFSGFFPRCAYFSGFKRFSKNGQKVNEMAKTEATVTSGVKNWYINFFIGIVGPCGMPIGDKNVIFFSRFRFLAFKVFRAPPSERVYTPPGPPDGPPPYPLPREASGGTTGGLRPQLRRDAKTEGENEFSHADRSADLDFGPGAHISAHWAQLQRIWG